ncbi:MAG: 3-oxoacyl-ACP synthase III [Pirellulales bacterium]|nr:3-oxoacyl-ACP synthase III [Pirellulales bacterium]
MRYSRVCLEAFGYTLPDEVVTTDELERRLAPAYERLRLPAGRLELMTGIRERRFYPPGTRPGQVSIESGRRAIAAAGIDAAHIGALVHGSVCRDFLEPATACGVHHALGLPENCLIYDASNACLGILTGMLQVANMIELGQIRAGLVVGTEDGRSLVETTVERLNTDAAIDRRSIKQYVASLTIGSGSVAVLLCDEALSRPSAVSSGPNGKRHRLLGGAVVANTAEHRLCQSEGLETFMRTDSEQLKLAGVATGARTFELFLKELGWSRGDVSKTICHQVGAAHRKLLFEQLGLSESLDFSTFETLGNTGAAALPMTMAIAAEQGHFAPGDRVAMLGIGSGINCQMLGVEWGRA